MVLASGQHRFRALDALRGIAALWVVYFHIYGGLGYLAVDFFLVLSGFILSYRYLYSGRPTVALEFINHRLARLYPLHLYTLLMFMAVHWFIYRCLPSFPDGMLFTFVQQLTLTHNIGLNPNGLTWNYPSWSVSVEFFVNLLFIFFITRTSRSSVLFLLGTLGILILYGNHGQLNTHVENYYGFLNSGLLRGMASFLLGIVSYRLYQYYRDDWRVARYGTWLELACVLAVLGIVLSRTGKSNGMDVFVPYIALLMVAVFACEQGQVSRGLRKLAYLGEISYSVYLNHLVVLMLVRQYATHHRMPQAGVLGLTLCFALVYSHFTHRYLELPLGKAMRRGLAWLTASPPPPMPIYPPSDKAGRS